MGKNRQQPSQPPGSQTRLGLANDARSTWRERSPVPARPPSHVRIAAARWGRGLRRLLDVQYVRDVMRAADPTRAHFRLALRATATGIAAAIVLHALLQWAHQPSTLLIIGVGIGTMSTLWVNDPVPRAQAITLACVPPAACVGLGLGTALSVDVWLEVFGFMLVIFGAVYARAYGPRGNGLGMAVLIAYVYALFLGATLVKLPWMSACILVAVALGFVMRFAIVRDRPASEVRLAWAGFDAAARACLRLCADALRAGDWAGERRAILIQLANLNAIALQLEDSRAVAPGDALRMFRLELALDRLAASCRRAVATATEPERLQLAASVLQARAATDANVRAELAQLSCPTPECRRVAADLQAWHELRAGTARVDDEPWRSALARARASLPPPPSAAAPRDQLLRQALQATLAAGAASAVGRLLSYSRWYWAVLASFVIFSRASSRGDTLIRAAHRLGGTAAGLAAGIALAQVARAMPALTLPLLFAALFVGMYFLRVSYGVMVAGITVAIALLYSLLGRPIGQLLDLRLEETAAGAIIGMMISMSVMPIRTRSLISERIAQVLVRVRDSLDQAAAQLEQGSWSSDVMAAVRGVDRTQQSLRAAAAPFSGRIASSAFPALTQQMLVVAALVYQTRLLVHDVSLQIAGIAADTRAQLAAELRAQAARLGLLATHATRAQPPARVAADGGKPAPACQLGDLVTRAGELIAELEQLQPARV